MEWRVVLFIVTGLQRFTWIMLKPSMNIIISHNWHPHIIFWPGAIEKGDKGCWNNFNKGERVIVLFWHVLIAKWKRTTNCCVSTFVGSCNMMRLSSQADPFYSCI